MTDAITTDTVTQTLPDSRSLDIPWVGFGETHHAQITLIDDKIAVHKVLDENIEYKPPCKAGEDSYIRNIGLIGVTLPKILLEKLGIASGGEIDLSLEENCIVVRKRVSDEPLPAEPPEKPEPPMAICCVCGQIRYTANGMKKVEKKYICGDCVEAVKAL
jgi:hypothetical protein